MLQDIFDKKDEIERRLLEYLDNPANAQSGEMIDPRLMTFTEDSILNQASAAYESLIRKRSVELGFDPYSLTKEQQKAVFLCLSFEELRPVFKQAAVREKNLWLRKNLSETEKLIVRRYSCLTYQMAGSEPPLRDPIMSEVRQIGKKARVLCVFGYFSVMETQHELVFEKPCYFCSKRRRQVACGEGVQEYVQSEDFRKRLFKRKWWEQE